MTARPNVVALTGAIRSELPACCANCVFWQSLTGTTDTRRKDQWVRAFEDRSGAWGRALYEGDAFLGMVQYGPASAFPRARALPAGPPAPDGMLVTCSYLTESDPRDALERLLLEALADAKARSFETVDAFATGPADVPPGEDRLLGHHTLFPRVTLTRLGFEPVRARGPIALMRLALRGLQGSEASVPAASVEPRTAPARS